MEADKTILQMKYARIVKLFAEQTGISLEDSLEIFYDSYVYKMMSEGIADMHCRSDGYLAGLLVDEWRNEMPPFANHANNGRSVQDFIQNSHVQ